MIDSFKRSYPVYLAIDIILIVLSFLSAYFIKYVSIDGNRIFYDFPNPKGYIFIFAIWTLFILIAFSVKNLHCTDRGVSIPKELGKVITAVFYTSLLIGAIIFFIKFKFFSRQTYFTSIVFLNFFLGGFRLTKRLILRRLIKKGFHNINILIIGAGELGKIIYREIKKANWWGFKIVGFLDDDISGDIGDVNIEGRLDDLIKIAKKLFVDEVIVTIPIQDEKSLMVIQKARQIGIGVKVVPANIGQNIFLTSTSYLGATPLVTYKERVHHPTELILKRLFDFFISFFIFVLSVPLLLIIMVWIRIDSSGPIFFVRERIGLKGKVFKFYKFRSMVKGAESLREDLTDENEVEDGIIFKIRKDPRVTKVGKILRRFSLDEMPQLLNVLKGDMSLVGPRPPLPEEVKQYAYHQIERLSIRPGLTGLSQVRGRSDLSFRNWVRWDVWYINNWSFGLDLQILFWTIPIVLKGRGAY